MKSNKKNSILKKFFNFIFTTFCAVGLVFCLNSFAQSPQELNFVHISDVHFSKELDNTPYKLRKNSPELFDDAIEQINEIPNLSFVMFGGDLVDTAKEKELLAFLEHSQKIKSPWYFTFGNHDSMIGGYLTPKRYLSNVRKQNSNFKYDNTYYSFSPKAGFKVIALDSIIRDRLTSNGEISKSQLEWLDKELANSQKEIVLIFTHVPIQQPISAEHHKMLNSTEVMNVIGKYKNPIAIFQGHYHVTKVKQMNNLLFVSTPALVSYPNAYRQIKISSEDDKVIFNIKTINTKLENLRNKAKLFIITPEIPEGNDEDKNGIFVIPRKK